MPIGTKTRARVMLAVMAAALAGVCIVLASTAGG